MSNRPAVMPGRSLPKILTRSVGTSEVCEALMVLQPYPAPGASRPRGPPDGHDIAVASGNAGGGRWSPGSRSALTPARTAAGARRPPASPSRPFTVRPGAAGGDGRGFRPRGRPLHRPSAGSRGGAGGGEAAVAGLRPTGTVAGSRARRPSRWRPQRPGHRRGAVHIVAAVPLVAVGLLPRAFGSPTHLRAPLPRMPRTAVRPGSGVGPSARRRPPRSGRRRGGRPRRRRVLRFSGPSRSRRYGLAPGSGGRCGAPGRYGPDGGPEYVVSPAVPPPPAAASAPAVPAPRAKGVARAPAAPLARASSAPAAPAPAPHTAPSSSAVPRCPRRVMPAPNASTPSTDSEAFTDTSVSQASSGSAGRGGDAQSQSTPPGKARERAVTPASPVSVPPSAHRPAASSAPPPHPAATLVRPAPPVARA